MTRVLIIDDVRCEHQLEQHLGPRGFEFDQVIRAGDAAQRIATFKPDLVLLDLHFPTDAVDTDRTTGGRLHADLLSQFPDLLVVIFSTRPANIAIPAEAFDSQPLAILAKPDFSQPGWDEDFVVRLKRILDTHRRTTEELDRDFGFVVGRTSTMIEFARRLETAARTGDNLLLRGEPGTGKTLAAETAHRLSGRRGQFVTIRPAALSPERIAADLATSFTEADGGTLYLVADDLPDAARAILLGLLDGQPSNVRIITSVGRDAAAIANLRSDLLTRLRGLELALPPLLERLDDIPELFARTVEAYNAQTEISIRPILRPETLSKLKAYDWPGNIRELEAVLRQALTFTRNDVLMPDDVDFDLSLGTLPVSQLSAQQADAAVTPKASNATEEIVARIEAIPQGQARYDEYKRLPKYLLPRVTACIIAQLAAKMKSGKIMKQSELTSYFYGEKDPESEKHNNAVRRFLSTNKLWRA